MHNIYDDERLGAPTAQGMKKLRTPGEVDSAIRSSKGTMLVFVDSNCGCAARVARPALEMALHHRMKPGSITTVFASTDREATAQARKYFTDQPPSSPAFALLRDGKFLGMIHRAEIRTRTSEQVKQMLAEMFERFCAPGPAVLSGEPR